MKQSVKELIVAILEEENKWLGGWSDDNALGGDFRDSCRCSINPDSLAEKLIKAIEGHLKAE